MGIIRGGRLMTEVNALFWDVGGVILTNGWDRAAREHAVREFHLEGDEFRERHDLAVPALETGQITLDEYLERTVFFQARTFAREAFKAFMFAESREHAETRAIVTELARSRKYLMATINNEGLELNLHRIQQFNLAETSWHFSVPVFWECSNRTRRFIGWPCR